MPDAGREVLGGPGHDGDVEDGLVAAALQLAQDEHVVVLVHQVLARLAPTEKGVRPNKCLDPEDVPIPWPSA